MNELDTAIDAEVLAGLRDLAADDHAFLDDLFAVYVDQAEDVVRVLRGTLADGDRSRFGAAAHRLAGASLNVGALFVAAACQSIETAMVNASASPSASHIEAVEKELSRVIAAIATMAVARRVTPPRRR